MKRLFSLLAAFAMLLSFAVLPLSALTPSYKVGDAYKSSKYYDKLIACELTGDMRYDVLSVAFTQIGYHEGNNESEMNGMNLSGSRNFVEYNRIFGKVDNNEGNGISYGYAWCAAFVSWCLRQAGVPKELAVTEISCNRMTKWFQVNSTYHSRSSGYRPLPGDIIMFHDGDNSADHVGVVVGIKGGNVYTIEGNSGGVVGPHLYSLTDSYILGYCVPAYTVKAGTNYGDFTLDDNASKPGEYFITADVLNVRAGAGTSFARLGTLKRGDIVVVTLCDGSWGRIDFNGQTAWISMSYAIPLKYYSYTVKYIVGDGSGAPADQSKKHGESINISSTVPQRDHYSFEGWSTGSAGGNVEYRAGAVYSEDRDLTLYAVWKPNIYKLTLKLDDGSVWKTVEAEYGQKVVVTGTPEKASDGEYEYTFAGWNGTVPQYLSEDLVLTARFDAVSLTTVPPEPETTPSEPTTEAPEPETTPSEPTTEAPEPETTPSEPTTEAPEPETTPFEPTTEASEPETTPSETTKIPLDTEADKDEKDTDTEKAPSEKGCAGFGALAAALVAVVTSLSAAVVFKKNPNN